MFRLIAINFSQKSPHFSLLTVLSPTSPCELSEREVTSPSNLKVVGALGTALDKMLVQKKVLKVTFLFPKEPCGSSKIPCQLCCRYDASLGATLFSLN